MKNKKREIAVAAALIFFAALYIILLELSKNILIGWGIGLAIIVLFYALRLRYAKKGNWKPAVSACALVCMLLLLLANYFLTAPREKRVPAVSYRNPAKTEIVHVQQGDITGVYDKEHLTEIYAGIPYAKAPVGELRWKEPQAPDSWDGVKACDTFAPKEIQPVSSELYSSLSAILGTHDYEFSWNDQYTEAMSEDCLYLNVFAPADYDGEPLPVVFYVHGGSLTTGSSYYSKYRGESFAKKGVILVNFGYRLGVFGYMANKELIDESPNRTTGDYGLLDQIMALKWVHENIASFGGDPDNITIAGESAGASSVNALCVSPLTEGLFVRAIAESSSIVQKKPYHTFREKEDALLTGEKIMEEFGATNIEELRSIDGRELVKNTYPNDSMCVDGYAITEQPYLTYEKGENHEQALLNGSNLKEADAFLFERKVTKDNYVEELRKILGDYAEKAAELVPPGSITRDQTFIVDSGGEAKGSLAYVYSDGWFSYSHYNWSRYMEKQGRPVYQYFFTKTNPYLSNHHAGEIIYAYGNLWRHPGMYDEKDYALSEIMQTYWTNFAKTGDPNKGSDNGALESRSNSPEEAIPNWPLWNSKEDILLELNDDIRLIENPYHELNKLFDAYQSSVSIPIL
ncbi:MAG: carboxylesterase family protein [Butyrivibrio sp.]|nr:carboxylesterase family protein [Butyrivibrio sp.]